MPTVEISHNLDLGPELPEEFLEVARSQGEDPSRVCADIQDLRDLIYEKGNCKPHRTDDEFLLKFLRARYFKLEHAYQLLCNYYKFREDNRELFEDIYPLRLTSLGNDNILTVAPYRDQSGRRLIIYRFGNWKPSKISVNEIFKTTLVLLEMGSLEPIAQVVGGVGIFDLKGLSLNHILHVNPSVAQKIIQIMVSCMPLRTEAIHIVNQNWVFDTVFKIFKPFLNERMKRRIFVHGSDYESLHKHIDPGHLPITYGGQLPETPYTEWIHSINNNKKICIELQKLGYRFHEDGNDDNDHDENDELNKSGTV